MGTQPESNQLFTAWELSKISEKAFSIVSFKVSPQLVVKKPNISV